MKSPKEIENLSNEELLKEIAEMVEMIPDDKCENLYYTIVRLKAIWDTFSQEKPFKFSDLSDEQIKSIGYENCPLRCASCEEACKSMTAAQCRQNLSQEYDSED